MIKLPESAVLKVYIHASLNEWSLGELSVFSHDMTKYRPEDYVVVKVVDLEVPLGGVNFDPTAQIVAALTAKRDKLKADYYVADKAIADQIDELTAIENKGEDNA